MADLFLLSLCLYTWSYSVLILLSVGLYLRLVSGSMTLTHRPSELIMAQQTTCGGLFRLKHKPIE